MTSQQPSIYHRQYLRWHRQQERVALRIVLARFRQLSGALTHSLHSVGPVATSGMLGFLISENAHLAMVQAIYTQVGPVAAQRQYDRLLPAKSASLTLSTKDRDPSRPASPGKPNSGGLITISFHSNQWRDRMVQLARSSDTASRISGMTDKTRQLVRDVLTEGAAQVWTITKLAQKVRAVVVDRTRALLIARTETTRAANAGHEAGAMSTLLKLNKLWIATLDARTRETHLEAARQKPIARDALFAVGGTLMRYPGDPAGGAKECASCRCVVSYVPSRDNLN